jgi:hypothetical protein
VDERESFMTASCIQQYELHLRREIDLDRVESILVESSRQFTLPVVGDCQQDPSAKSAHHPTEEHHPEPADQGKGCGHESARTEFGVARVSCACKECRFFCNVMPGRLIPADLDRLIPPGEDPLAWARVHLRATPYRVLVPARTARRGPCHWLTADGRCAVHADAPFGCAMFHCKLPSADEKRLKEGGNIAIIEDHARKGRYATIWKSLWDEGLRDCDVENGKATAWAYCDKLKNQADRK